MEKIKKVFIPNEEYLYETSKFTKTDLLLTLILCVILTGLYMQIGLVYFYTEEPMTENFKFVSTGILSGIEASIVFAFCIVRKQSLSSIGFSRTNSKKSLTFAIILCLGVTILFTVIAVVSGSDIQKNVKLITMKFFYYFVFIAFVEELVFRGYIGTRLYGCLENKVLSITISGLIFTFMHIPVKVMMTDMGFIQYISYAWADLISVFILHFLLQFLYGKCNSIIAPILFHFIWDFVQWLIV